MCQAFPRWCVHCLSSLRIPGDTLCSKCSAAFLTGLCSKCHQRRPLNCSRWCPTCRDLWRSAQPGVALVAPASHKFAALAAWWQRKWLHTAWSGRIVAVLRVCNGALRARYKAYLRRISNEMREKSIPVFHDAAPGNPHQRFHGTAITCRLHETLELCGKPECCVCSIVAEGFRLSGTGERFGTGVYLTATSSKANDYAARRTDAALGFRAVFIVDAAVGRVYRAEQSTWGSFTLPSGFHSILGNAGHAGLNYDEVVLPVPEATFPHYIVIYSMN